MHEGLSSIETYTAEESPPVLLRGIAKQPTWNACHPRADGNAVKPYLLTPYVLGEAKQVR
jgi:hypothetical protein